VFDADNNAYFTTAGDFAGKFGNQILKVTQDGAISRFAGGAHIVSDTLWRTENGYTPEWGDASAGLINGPYNIAIHPVNGTIYFEDRYNKYIRSIRPVYNITYEGNGHTGGTLPDTQRVLGHKPATIASQGELVKKGHTFLKWNTAADGSDNDYAAGDSLTLTADLTLYAIWGIEKYNLIYNAGTNGTLTSGGLTKQTVIRNENVLYNTTIDDPVIAEPNSGYGFGGWDDGEENASRQDTAIFSFGVTANFLKEHTVTFVTYDGTAISQQFVLDDRLLTLPTPPIYGDIPFDGWYTDAERTMRFDESTKITSDRTLYANWATKYTVSINAHNGAEESNISVTEATYMSPIPDPVRTGYTFQGWYIDNDIITQAFDFTTTPITGDISLHAKWKINSYTVTFATYGGTAIDSQTVNYKELVSGPVTTAREGYSFVGWYTDADFDTPFDIANTAITSDVPLYAKWALTPPGAPAIVSTTPSNAKVELVWSGVPFAMEYTIYKGTTSGTASTMIATVTDSVYRYKATGLTNGTTYYFVIAAVNESGGNRSVEVSATPKTVPGAPTGVTAVADNGQATITFAAPADNGGSAIIRPRQHRRDQADLQTRATFLSGRKVRYPS
jgi:uncharacterized repeat protein (TIGR02543 family)